MEKSILIRVLWIFFDGLDELLPRFDKEIMLKYFSPIALSEKDEDGYYLWNPDDNRPLTSWYRDNKQGIKEACNGFINTIPSEVRHEAAAFTCGYIAGNQWFLIKQSQLYPSFIELMRANPALAYTFAHRKVLGLKTKRLGKKDTERLLAGKHRKNCRVSGPWRFKCHCTYPEKDTGVSLHQTSNAGSVEKTEP